MKLKLFSNIEEHFQKHYLYLFCYVIKIILFIFVFYVVENFSLWQSKILCYK